jgi:hypothetical protein
VGTLVQILMGMIGYFGTGPLWVCVKVDDYCEPSSIGILTTLNRKKGMLSALLPPTTRSLQ